MVLLLKISTLKLLEKLSYGIGADTTIPFGCRTRTNESRSLV